jgi:hypothetical protein
MDGVEWDSIKEKVTVELENEQGAYTSVISSQRELVELIEEAAVQGLQDEMPMYWTKEREYWDYSTEAQEFLIHGYQSEMDSVGGTDAGW